VVMSWVDTCGVNRVKTVPVSRLVSAVRWGVGMSPVFDLFLADDSIASSKLQGGPDGDLRLVPDLDQVVPLAGQPGWAWAPVDRMTQDGVMHGGCSRTLLRRLVAGAEEQGLTFKAGIEIEFALGRGDVPWPDFEPACRGSAYGMTRLVEQADFCADALRALAEQGVDVDQIHPEYAAGQYEVSVGVLDPVGAADRSVLVRQTLRAVAQRHGLRISFAPSVVAGGVGNGGHLHVSAWRGGANLHSTGDGRYGMTADGENEIRRPCRCATARKVCRTSTDRSAAPTGSSAPTDTSYCPAAYSGWIWSTSTPSAARVWSASAQKSVCSTRRVMP